MNSKKRMKNQKGCASLEEFIDLECLLWTPSIFEKA